MAAHYLFRLTLMTIGLAAVAFAAPGPQTARRDAPTSSAAELQALGEQLRALKRQHDEAAGADELIPLEEQPFASPPGLKGAWTVVELGNAMNNLASVWTFEPLDVPDLSGGSGQSDAGAGTAGIGSAPRAQALRVPLPLHGEQAIVLPPGKWRATLLAGNGQTGEHLRRAPRELTLRNHTVYRLALGSDAEQAMTQQLRERARAAAAALEDRAPGAAGDTRASGARGRRPPAPLD